MKTRFYRWLLKPLLTYYITGDARRKEFYLALIEAHNKVSDKPLAEFVREAFPSVFNIRPLEAERLQKGDKVLCNNPDKSSGYLMRGAVYTIKEVIKPADSPGKVYLLLTEVETDYHVPAYWDPERFERV